MTDHRIKKEESAPLWLVRYDEEVYYLFLRARKHVLDGSPVRSGTMQVMTGVLSHFELNRR